jgi:hypothetical protein
MVKKKTLPSWNEIKNIWLAEHVPEIEVVPFMRDFHFRDSHWASKDDPRMTYQTTNPENATAWHLRHLLPSEGIDFQIAYKIYVAIRRSTYDELTLLLLKDHFEPAQVRVFELWHGSAQYLLPTTATPVPKFPHYPNESEMVLQIVKDAATVWKVTASEYVIIDRPRNA